jgi:hypothetical protein
MRKLSNNFLKCLKTGFLSPITKSVIDDPDLVLDIRDGYINIYFKGNSLLKLTETSTSRYKVEIHEKFLVGVNLNIFLTEENVDEFVKALPQIKQNIANHGRRSIEIEYEQLIVRANNDEQRNNSEYFIVDRQYSVREGRFDLTGIFWDRRHRMKGQEVPVCLVENKFALNTDIKDVHKQLERYYDAVKPNASSIAEEMESIFRQKLELGLYKQSPDRLAAMKTLKFSREIEKFQFIVVFVDFNPNSTLLDLKKLADLPFANQVKVFQTGFAMWKQNVRPIKESI